MKTEHAAVHLDHHSAIFLQFEEAPTVVRKVHAHTHQTPQHRSSVRTEHEYFGEVCDAIEQFTEVLVTGSKTALADLRHYVEGHRPRVESRILGYEVVGHLTDGQLAAMARSYFDRVHRMRGVPTPDPAPGRG